MTSQSTNRSQAASAIAHLMPYIIQGAHLGNMNITGITQSQFFLLILLHTNGPSSMTAIAARVSVRMPTLTGIINRLVNAGYVKRIMHADDRRQVFVELTPKGRKMLKHFQGVLKMRWEDVLSILNDQEVKQFYTIMDKLIKKLAKP